MNKDENKGKKEQKSIAISFYKAFKSFATVLPILFGVILLIGLFRTFVSQKMISSVFIGGGA